MQRRVSGPLRDKRGDDEAAGLEMRSWVGGLVEGVVAAEDAGEPVGLEEAVDDDADVDRRR